MKCRDDTASTCPLHVHLLNLNNSNQGFIVRMRNSAVSHIAVLQTFQPPPSLARSDPVLLRTSLRTYVYSLPLAREKGLAIAGFLRFSSLPLALARTRFGCEPLCELLRILADFLLTFAVALARARRQGTC